MSCPQLETNKADKSIKTKPLPANGGPSIPAWVNEENFVDVVRGNTPGFKKILKFDVGLTGGAGENYLSMMYRIKVKLELSDGSSKDVAFMLKTVPQSGQSQKLVNMMGVFPKEAEMYSNCLPEFEQMYRDAGKNVAFGPKFYTLKTNDAVDYVLLEDLNSRGFKNVNRLEGLDTDHTESVLRILAELHAASAVRYETKGEYKQMFSKPIITEENKEQFILIHKSIHIIFRECFAQCKISDQYLTTVENLLKKFGDEMSKQGIANPDDFNVLIHGDLWTNNVMFRHNDEGKLEETYLIDYQMCRYGSPTTDLYFILLSSTSLGIKLSQFDYFIKYYHDHLIENLRLLNYSKKIPTMKDLRIQLLRHSFFAFSVLLGIMAAALLDPADNANVDNFIQDKEFQRQVFSNPRYIMHLEALIPWLDTKGMLG